MSINIDLIAEKVFNILKGFGYAVNSYDVNGKQVVDPVEATRFVVNEPNILVRLDQTNETLVLNTSEDLSEHDVRQMLKNLSNEYLMNFDYKIFNKTLKPKGEQVDIAKKQDPDMMEAIKELKQLAGLAESWDDYEDLETDPMDPAINMCPDCEGTGTDTAGETCQSCGGEGAIHESDERKEDIADVMEGFGTMTGSSKTSYQPLDNVKLVVKHKKPVSEEVRGARSRNIHSIYVQRGEERFKLPENNLAMARAMARHVQKGGEVFDTVGESISSMASDYRKLTEFVRYVRSAGIVNETNEEYVNLAVENINNIRDTFKKLSGSKTYQTAVEGLNQGESVEILEDDLDLESKFTEKHFDNKVAEVLGTLKSLSYKKQTFESYIKQAIAKEAFTNLKDLLRENDVIDFSTAHAKLSHQVSQLGYAATNENLGNYLHNVSKKINNGGTLNQFEYDTIKSCLLCASTNHKRQASMFKENVEETYEKFLDSFITL